MPKPVKHQCSRTLLAFAAMFLVSALQTRNLSASTAQGSDLSSLEQDLQRASDESDILELNEEKENIKSLFPHFKDEQLNRTAIGLVTKETHFRTLKSVLRLPPGTVMLVKRKDASGERYIGTLPDKRTGFVSKKDVSLLYTIEFLKALSYYNRVGWDFFLEPVIFLSSNPVRLGLGGRAAWAPWPNGFNGQKMYHLELSAHYLQSIKVRQASYRPYSFGATSDFYLRLGLGGRFMMGPSFGWNRYSSPEGSANQIYAGLKGRYMVTRNYGLFGEIGRLGVRSGAFRTVLGLSFGF